MDDTKLVKLTSCASQVEADMLINLLKAEGIGCVRKDNFTGDYLKVYAGYSIYGVDLYVNEDDLEVAQKLAECEEASEEDMEKAINEAIDSEDEYVYYSNDKSNDYQIEEDKNVINKRRLIAVIIVIVLLAGSAIPFIINFLQQLN